MKTKAWIIETRNSKLNIKIKPMWVIPVYCKVPIIKTKRWPAVTLMVKRQHKVNGRIRALITSTNPENHIIHGLTPGWTISSKFFRILEMVPMTIVANHKVIPTLVVATNWDVRANMYGIRRFLVKISVKMDKNIIILEDVILPLKDELTAETTKVLIFLIKDINRFGSLK